MGIDPDTGDIWIVALSSYREGDDRRQRVRSRHRVRQPRQVPDPARGLDDDWGSDKIVRRCPSPRTASAPSSTPTALHRPIADTLTNFTDGTIEDATRMGNEKRKPGKWAVGVGSGQLGARSAASALFPPHCPLPTAYCPLPPRRHPRRAADHHGDHRHHLGRHPRHGLGRHGIGPTAAAPRH